MNTVEQVKRARTPNEALQAIAQGIDALAAKLDERPAQADAWASWEAPADTEPEAVGGIEMRRQVEDAIEELTEKVRAETDPDERRAIEARIKLLKDELRPKPENPDADRLRSGLEVDEEGNAVVDLPPAPDHIKQARAELAERVNMEADLGPEVVEAFIKAGPLYLYYPNREYVMGLSEADRRAMVEDVAALSPAEGHEMGRDVLKDPSPGDLEGHLARIGEG